jgi:ATP synthase protein I
MFGHYRAQEPGVLLRRFYGAEFQKLLLTGLLFAATILWVKPLSAGALFGVFLLVQMTPVLIAHKLD